MIEYSNTPPEGNEKRIIDWFQRMIGYNYVRHATSRGKKNSVLNELMLENMSLPALTIEGAVNGQRTNGRQKVTGLIGVYREAKELQEIVNRNFVELKRYKVKLDVIMLRAKGKMEKFVTCPVCHGHQHEKDCAQNCHYYGCKHKTPSWIDCCYCNGRGIILRKVT